MQIKDLKNKQVAILGFGLEGKATLKYLLKHKIEPVIFDQKPWQEWSKSEQDEIKNLNINVIFGEDCFKELIGFDLAFKSPGINPILLKETNVKITSQTEWFFNNCPCKIIGITGTKGKGTTATLTYEILKKKYKKVFLTGNIGKIQPFEILDKLNSIDIVVYELSSFQLLGIKKSPHIAVVLMTTSEHLDYHKNTTEYLKAKSSITKYQTKTDYTIINSDFVNSINIGKNGLAKKLFFSRKKELVNGAFIKKGYLIVKENNKLIFKINLKQIKLIGKHNLENICASVLISLILLVPKDKILSVLKKFKGLKHRLELVSIKSGIKFFNDSFSTTPETTIAGIESFKEPLILILGGSSKNANFYKLGHNISNAKNIKTLILIGEEAKNILKFINNPRIKIFLGAKNMKEIFEKIKESSKKGDVVLLSPACASFDMFKNYTDRGIQFVKYAKKFN